MTPLPLGTFSIDLIPELDEYHTWTGMLKINIVAEKRHLSDCDEEDKPKIEYSNDSNVVKLSFRTKTKGSA
jgi:hypothetical protein